MKICLLGANFDIRNMGVGALAEGSIKCILHTWPDAEVTLLGPGRVATEHHLKLLGRNVCLKNLPVRFSKNAFLPNHFFRLLFYTGLIRLIRSKRIHRILAARNQFVKAILEADVVADITGGDSFSDIYGMFRFLQLTSLKILMLLLDKRLVLLPQTYGPFKRRISRTMAYYVLKRANAIYSRDKAGLSYVQKILGIRNDDERIRFCPDVAFILDARKPANGIPANLASLRTDNKIIVGLNISGLLYGPDGTRDNRFGLTVSYTDCVIKIIKMLLDNRKVSILLVPHVFSKNGDNSAKPHVFSKAAADWSDTVACRNIYEKMRADYPERIFVVEGKYDQAEIKYIIGMCDFFIGSRMHACIAALSQYIPAVGIAYSKKFLGVFESIDMGDCVADARTSSEKELLKKIDSAFEKRQLIKEHLLDTIPSIQRQVLDIFKESDL